MTLFLGLRRLQIFKDLSVLGFSALVYLACPPRLDPIDTDSFASISGDLLRATDSLKSANEAPEVLWVKVL